MSALVAAGPLQLSQGDLLPKIFAVNLVLSFPLTVHPVNFTIERNLFKQRHTKPTNRQKWLKNLSRLLVIIACYGLSKIIAWAGVLSVLMLSGVTLQLALTFVMPLVLWRKLR